MSYVLMGIGVYVVFAYVFEEYLIATQRWKIILLRSLVSFGGAFVVGGVTGLWYGLAVLGVSRIAARLDSYLTSMSSLISSQQR